MNNVNDKNAYVCVLGETKMALYKGAATFFNHVSTLAKFQPDDLHHVVFLKKKEVKTIMTAWAESTDPKNQLMQLPSPYPNFNTFTWKHSSINVNPMECTKNMLKSTLMAQPVIFLEIAIDVRSLILGTFTTVLSTYLKQDVDFSEVLHQCQSRRELDVIGAFLDVGVIPELPFSPNKKRKLDVTMPTTPLTPVLTTPVNTPIRHEQNVHDNATMPLSKVQRCTSTISYVNLLSPCSRSSITCDLHSSGRLLSPELQGMSTPTLTLSPSFKIEFTQNALDTPVKFLFTDQSAYSPTYPSL